MAKIMVVHHSGLIGGAGVSLINNLKQISAHHEVVVYLPSDPQDMIQMVREECPKVRIEVYGRRIGAITYYSGGDSLLSARFWYRATLILFQIPYWNYRIQYENADILLVNSSILCWMSGLKSVRKKKSICFVRETKTGNPHSMLNALMHQYYERFSRVVFISQYDKKVEQLQFAKSELIYDYIEESKFDNSITRYQAEEQLNLRHNDCFRVLYVGGVSFMKGFDLALSAIERSNAEVELVVAGISSEDAMLSKSKSARDYAIKMEDRLRNSTRVFFVGKQNNMSYCYGACDVLLFPMRSAHQARPAFEAGYFKKPVLITDFPNIKEFVVDGENGLLFARESVDEIQKKIEFLFSHRDACQVMGQRNFEMCIEAHNEEKNGQALMKMIEELSLDDEST